MKNARTHDNDDEPLTFTQLGLQTALLLNRIKNAQTLLELAKEKQEDRKRDTGGDRTDEERAEDKYRCINQRLREPATLEDRAGGKRNSRLR
jgi:hypothetical protein